MARILTRCPVCEGMLSVAELRCVRCSTSVRGSFTTCRFCRLAPEHLGFIELFLRCEGNLSRVEKEMNLSYPTVRNRLQAALAALGLGGDDAAEPRHSSDESQGDLPFATEPAGIRSADNAESRRNVLDALSHGDISADEAAAALRDLL